MGARTDKAGALEKPAPAMRGNEIGESAERSPGHRDSPAQKHGPDSARSAPVRSPAEALHPRPVRIFARVIGRAASSMASYHLNVATISRAAGRSATAAAAYRAAERIDCEREGRSHDYTRKSGVLHAEIVAPENAPEWVTDRTALWNGAEASENRKNSVVAREWLVALPDELGAEERRELALDFAHALVERFGVAADVAIHAPHRDGDARNHHAHILTTTRRIGPEGFTEKTRELDDRKRGSVEIEAMRGDWADRQNSFLDRAGSVERVDHRSLEVQYEEAEAKRYQAQVVAATAKPEDREAREAELVEARFREEALDREPEVKLGPVANAIERKEKRAAEREGREYVPRTERGAQVHASRQARAVFDNMRERLTLARETYTQERKQGQDRISAGLEAIRAAASRDRGGVSQESIAERLNGILERAHEGPGNRDPKGRSVEERLREITGQEQEQGRVADPPEAQEEARHRFDDRAAEFLASIRESRSRVEDHHRDTGQPLTEEELRERLDKGIEREEQAREEAERARQERRAELEQLWQQSGSAEALRELVAMDAADIAKAQAEKNRARGIDRVMDVDFE